MLDQFLSKLATENQNKRIGYCDIDDDRVHDAVKQLLELGENPVACGYRAELQRYENLGIETIIAPDGEESVALFLGKKLQEGSIDGMVGGAKSSTRDILRAGIKGVGVAEGIKKMSSHFIMGNDYELMLFADCAVMPKPSSEELAEIGFLTVKNALKYGIDPRVAMLSFSTAGSGGDHPDVVKIREAKRLLQELLQDHDLGNIPVAGEVQFDAAFIPEIGKKKDPDTPLTEPANVFIFPDLNSGNIAYKVAERLGGMTAIGPILQGLAKPVNDLSRGCSVEDIIAVHHITKNQ